MAEQPDGTAVAVALARAAHVEFDAPPYVLEDRLGLDLVAPPSGWQEQARAQGPLFLGLRASVVGRARLVEDVVIDCLRRGVNQYVILGAGLDTFALRRTEVVSDLAVFEVDEPGTQAWKRRRLQELGWALPSNLRFVPVDFEAGRSWVAATVEAGYESNRPAVVSSMGVSQYINQEANLATLRETAGLASGSLFVGSFLVPREAMDPADRPSRDALVALAVSRGCPYVSFFTARESASLAEAAGLVETSVLDAAALAQRYFAGRSDGLRPSSGESYLVATVP